jgi:hypothetical protein
MKILLIYITTIICSVILLTFGWYTYPSPGGDSVLYMPTSLSLTVGDGLISYFAPLPIQLDPVGENRVLVYTPLFFMIVGHLTWEPTAQAAFFLIALFSVLNLIIASVLFYKATTFDNRHLDWFATFLIIASIGGVCTTLVYQQSSGRPETLVTFWLLLGILVAIYTPPNYRWLPLGTMLGLLGATHPVGAVLSTWLVSIYFAVSYTLLPALRHLAQTAIVSIGVFVGIMLLGPYSILEVIAAIRQAAPLAGGAGESLILISSWITSPQRPFYGLIALLATGYLLFICAYRFQSIRAKLLFFPFVFLFLYSVYQFSILYPFRVYNLLILAPLWFITIIWLGTHDLPVQYKKVKQVSQFALLFVLALSTIGFIRHVILFPVFLDDSSTLSDAQSVVQEFVSDEVSSIGFTSSLWTLFDPDDYHRMYPVYPNGELSFPEVINPGEPLDIIIIQQNYSGNLQAPDISGYTRVYNSFVPHHQYLWGVKVANTTPGYAFAVYERDTANGTQE